MEQFQQMRVLKYKVWLHRTLPPGDYFKNEAMKYGWFCGHLSYARSVYKGRAALKLLWNSPFDNEYIYFL